MLETGGDPDFSKEALRTERLHQFGMQDLERDRPLVPKVVGQVDRGHAAAPELALEYIPTSKGLSELWGWCGHRYRRAGDASKSGRAGSVPPTG